MTSAVELDIGPLRAAVQNVKSDGLTEKEIALVNELVMNPTAELSESTIKELSAIKVTPKIKEFFNATETALWPVMDAIYNCHDTDNATQKAEWDLFQQIEQDFTDKKAHCATLASTASNSRDSHHTCRFVEEQGTYDNSTHCNETRAKIKWDLDVCYGVLVRKTGCFTELFCTPPNPGEGVPGTDAEVTARVEEKITCTEAYPPTAEEYIRLRDLYNDKVIECNNLQRIWIDCQAECCEKQNKYETDVCSTNDCMNDACSTYSSAYNARKADYDIVDAKVVKNAKKRQFTDLHLFRIHCILGNIQSQEGGLEETRKRIEQCFTKSPYGDKGTEVGKHLEILSKPAPAKLTCDTVPPSPCENDFITAEYTNRLNISATPPCECQPCV